MPRGPHERESLVGLLEPPRFAVCSRASIHGNDRRHQGAGDLAIPPTLNR